MSAPKTVMSVSSKPVAIELANTNDSGPMKTRHTTATAASAARSGPWTEYPTATIGTEKDIPKNINSSKLFLK